MSGALSVVPVRPTPLVLQQFWLTGWCPFRTQHPKAFGIRKGEQGMLTFSFLGQLLPTSMIGGLLSHNTRHYPHNQLLETFQISSIHPTSFILLSSSWTNSSWTLADNLVRYPCKYPSDHITIIHLYRRHLACPIISHLQPSQDIILTSFLFFVNRPL